MKSLSLASGLALAALALPLSPAFAQTSTPPPPDDKDQQANDSYDLDSVIVTGTMRVRQGGAQDIKHFRNAAAGTGLPLPEGLTVEGLMGEHDLTLPSSTACRQLFCIVAESMPAALPLRADDRLFVGVGFASNLDAREWKREPLNLVAVVDQSGSMDGEPLDLVRQSLLKILGQMRAGDRMSIILYGDDAHVVLKPTNFAGNRDRIAAAIRAISSQGSTDMESGLRLGYDTALGDAPGFKGNTRVMLFTDEQPNVGATDAESFIGMAEAASHKGIGLTTIGVGVQFDAGLATQVSSTRGGNLFFISDAAEVASVFDKQLDTMGSEVAHDLALTLRPAPGYKISGVFGVPADVMEESAEGTITVRVPTVFLSTNGGGIFATLAKTADRKDLPAAPIAPGTPVLDASVTWNDAKTNAPGADHAAAMAPSAKPSVALQSAHLLVDEFLAVRDASVAYHKDENPKAAFALLDGLAGRIQAASLPGMSDETKLVGNMRAQAAFYSGYGGELPKAMRHLAVVGRWQVTGATGFEDIHRGDQMEFTKDMEMLTYRKASGFDSADETEDYEINENQVHLIDSRLVMRYSAKGDRMQMSLNDNDGRAHIWLRRMD
ncbi:VWA domain-containing protein [Sphingomonas sp. R-74633]|uniref:vWA domain-containing protein n=1 Tax=Sphingomonas sp. R-74633 TaxID=2751188 RepID=UPI0015D1C519|nr:VWA domain-containing protein [Sphingomonas sp. R-74633]NYT43062.1 VWA domain-containing protein [Sphingomonas sp. R-74633]